ncbi:MAG: hypothetical protein CMF96_00720 [Candidatus Marinimicrobia bacterium]|nr:hypothetical protein [Candidatus Neomarinimicrobiota bacterium]|tara:strand:+ start:4161 stop:6149 length:1989 start_codon:yes stop_codon:yes gene_type:complete
MSLKELHSNDVQVEDQLLTEVVLISEIENELNVNALDGYDIKEFIELKINNNPGIRYLLIFGDETYFPPIYSGDTPSDDYYSSMDGILPTISTGRIPVAYATEAEHIVNKVREYTLNASPGIWKQKFMLTADDYRKQNYSADSEMRHTEYSQDLYDIVKDYAIVDTYLGSEYNPEPGEGWITLPELTNDIINGLNQGTAVINYIGHGTFYALADEKILLKDRDIALINPIDNKYAIWVIGTCSFGHYDGEDSMPEDLINSPNGAIGIITTSRSVYTGTNIEFLRKIFFQFKQYMQGLNSNRLGDIAFFAKTNSNNGNYSLFHLFGDPAMKLPFFIKNDLFLNESDKNIVQLESNELELSINSIAQNYISIKSEDYFSTITIEENDYEIFHPGNIIFTNQLNNYNSFILPMDAPPCESCLQINIYSEDLNGNYVFDNSYNWTLIENSYTNFDQKGPLFSISIDNNSVNSGDLIKIPTILKISLSDANGINTFGGIGHKISYKLNENSVIDITNLYEGITDTNGIIQIPLNSIEQYNNTIKFSAWDNINNQTISEYNLFFKETDEFELVNLFPYPNPFKDEVEFTYHINEPADIEIIVYEMSGKKIFSERYYNIQPGLIRSQKWSGIAENGFLISSGVYFYTVKATSINSGISIQKLQKIAKIY